jgi:hypothetical protein
MFRIYIVKSKSKINLIQAVFCVIFAGLSMPENFYEIPRSNEIL